MVKNAKSEIELTLLLFFHAFVPTLTSFTRKIVTQSSPVVNAENTITISLMSDVIISGNTLITITGFDDANANSPLLLLSVSGGNKGEQLFSTGSLSNAALFTNGQVLLTISGDKVLNASTAYAFSFVIQNPSDVAGDASISIETESIAVAMDTTNEPLLGVINGRNPMVKFHLFSKRSSHPFLYLPLIKRPV
jgi:hypothetical protein